MNTIVNAINDAIKAALRAKKPETLKPLRMLKNSMDVSSKTTGRNLTDSESVSIIRKEIKKRTDAATAFTMGNRVDLAKVERYEVEVLSMFLPTEMQLDELDVILDAAIAETGATGPKSMGAVMKIVTAKVAGRMEGKAVSTAVTIRLKALAPA